MQSRPRGKEVAISRHKLLALALVVTVALVPGVGATASKAAAPLIADAGDSAYLAVGEPTSLGGMAWGGTTPYSYAWSLKGKADHFTRPTSANTLFKTDGLKPGDYVLTLNVKDAAGAKAHDTVKIRVYSTTPTPILNVKDSVSFGTPDELAFEPGPDSPDGLTKVYPFKVPAGVRGLYLALSWTTHTADPVGVVGVNDFDLYVEGPDAAYKANTSGATAAMPEKIHIENPKPGDYKAIVAPFVSLPEDYQLTVGIVKNPPANPVPEIELPATYRFVDGQAQVLAAKLKAPKDVSAGWDLNFDGVYEKAGSTVTPSFGRGTRLATFKATKNGFEARRTTAITVASADEIAANTSPFVVVGVGDTGINPYHEEFSAEAYPDPEILRITANFTKHPSEYLPGYPKSATALPVTLGQGYLPKVDEPLWSRDKIESQKLYWIPGTKIVGAIDWSDSKPVNGSGDVRPILDEDGHGTESSSVSTGNRFGYCPACLLAFAEGLSGDEFLVEQKWVDVVSMSTGTVGNVGIGIDSADFTKTAAERGQTILYAAGNGFGNAFDAPMSTYTSASAGPDWNVIVGAARTDNKRPIIGDAMPVDISSWGDGTIPSACGTGDVSMCNFGGTSAATPLTAGTFGQVLREVRRALGDTKVGQRPNQVIAEGQKIAASAFLRDGKLTRAEFWDIVFHAADPFGPEGPPVPPYTTTWPGPAATDFLFGGYGLATPSSALRAIDVALGRAPLPEASTADEFFALDAQIRQQLWGTWNSGEETSASGEGAMGVVGASRSAFAGLRPSDVATPERLLSVMQGAQAKAAQAAAAGKGVSYYLHHAGGCPPAALPVALVEVPGLEDAGYTFMNTADTAGDDEPCPNARATTVAAYFRPVGLWASSEPIGRFVPAGSAVDATAYLTMEHPMLLEATGLLLAGGRIVGQGASAPTPVLDVAAARCRLMPDDCWTEVPIRFTTSRPVGAHEVLTFQVAVRTSEDTYFGYEGAHASKVVVTPGASAAASDLIASVTSLVSGATVKPGLLSISGTAKFGDVESQSLRKVELSVDDPTFSAPIAAHTAKDYTAWTARVPVGVGQHTIYARALQDRRASQADAVRVFSGTSVLGTKTNLPATGVAGRVLLGVALMVAAAVGLTLLRRTREDA